MLSTLSAHGRIHTAHRALVESGSFAVAHLE
jgi:hypothetical protein